MPQFKNQHEEDKPPRLLASRIKESMDLSAWYIVILKNFQFKTWHKSENLQQYN